MAKGLIDHIIDGIFDAEWVGKRGEKLTERELKLVQLLGRKGKTLRNVYIPKDNGETSEIDVLFITQKGIFVIESKNYSGWIFGDEKSMNWTVMLNSKTKNKLYNPIKQNRTHIKWLGQYLGEEIPLFSLIVFSERCELKKVNVESTDVRVIKRDQLYANVRDIWNATEDTLNEEQINAIYEKLKNLTNVDKAIKEAHVETIKKKYQKKTVKEAMTEKSETDKLNSVDMTVETALKIKKSVEDTIVPDISAKEAVPDVQKSDENANLICPRCGGKLVLREAKKGKYAGNQFYGCSNFPKCRYTKN